MEDPAYTKDAGTCQESDQHLPTDERFPGTWRRTFSALALHGRGQGVVQLEVHHPCRLSRGRDVNLEYRLNQSWLFAELAVDY